MAARMRAETQLDYAIFQLTPTRTRCELHIAALGSTYKLASGLLKPFVSHLKTAEEQLTTGGYSIRLEPPDPDRATWFTKGTMERFVRFVSTPELLERVSTVETELAELEETTRQQLAETNDSNSVPQADSKALAIIPIGNSAGVKSTALASAEKSAKATAAADCTESTGGEEGSKQRLLRALDARRAMLQKEQGMAFARAMAAGFNLENIDDLVLFSECFGASRLREACVKFIALCKKRQEAGLEIEEMDFTSADMGMVYPIPVGGGIESWCSAPQVEILTAEPEKNGGGGDMNGEDEGDNKTTDGGGGGGGGPKLAPMRQPWQQGQAQNAQYLLHHPPYGPPMHYGLPGQMAGPYPPYMGTPFMPPPPYPDAASAAAAWSMHPQYWNPGNQARDHDPIKDKRDRPSKLHDETTMDDGSFSDEAPESYAPKRGSSRRRSASPMRRVQKRAGNSKRSGMVVIRNINYIAPKAEKIDGDEDDDVSSGSSWNEEDGDNEDEDGATLRSSIDQAVGIVENLKQGSDSRNNRKRSSKKGGRSRKDDDDDAAAAIKRQSSTTVGGGEESDSKMVAAVAIDRDAASHHSTYDDNNSSQQLQDSFLGVLRRDRQQDSSDSFAILQTSELEFKQPNRSFVDSSNGLASNGYSRAEDMVAQREATAAAASGRSIGDLGPSDMLAERGEPISKKNSVVLDDSFMMIPDVVRNAAVTSADASHDFGIFKPADEKFADDSIVLLDRYATSDGGGHRAAWRMPLNLEMEMPAEMQQSSDDQNRDTAASAAAAAEPAAFEPEGLFMDADRSAYKRTAWDSYDMYYDMQVLEAERADHQSHEEDVHSDDAEEAKAQENGSSIHEGEGEEGAEKKSKGGMSGKDARTRAMAERRRGMSGGGRLSGGGGGGGRANPLAEAQLRAEKLREYKAGLQRSKKEKEEEERKRIEDLKNQRRERIAARTLSGGAATASAKAMAAPPPLAASSPSPKMPPKPTPSASPRDKISSAARLARLSSPKSVENPLSRSVPSSLAELHGKESSIRKSVPSSSSLRSSSTALPPSQKPSPPEPFLDVKSSNGHHHAEETKALRPTKPPHSSSDANHNGKPDNGHAEEKINRSNSNLAEQRIVKSSSNGSIPVAKKSTATDAPSAAPAAAKSPAITIPETVKPAAKKSAATDSMVVPKSPTVSIPETVKTAKKSIATDSPAGKSPRVVAAAKSSTVPAATETRSPKQIKKASFPSAASVTEKTAADLDAKKSVVKEQKARETATPLSSQQKSDNDPPEEASAARTSELFPEVNGTTAHENGSIVRVVEPSIIHHVVEEKDSSLRNGIAKEAPASAFVQEAVDASTHMVGGTVPANVMDDDDDDEDDDEDEAEASSLASENGGETAAADVNGNRDVNKQGSSAQEEGHGEQFSPLSIKNTIVPEQTQSPSSFLIRSPLEETMSSQSSPDPQLSSNGKSRKKWGDTKAKGLKKLLLLGRKSSRGAASTHNPSSSSPDIHSDGGEEEDILSGNGNGNEQAAASHAKADGAGGGGGVSSSSSKGSRSFFSLSLRGKSNSSSSSTVKA